MYLLSLKSISQLIELKINEYNKNENFSDQDNNLYSNFKIAFLTVTLVIGFLENLLNMIIFGQKNMRNKSTFKLLLYLSIIDIVVLSTGAMDLFIRETFTYDIRSYSNFVCKFSKKANFKIAKRTN